MADRTDQKRYSSPKTCVWEFLDRWVWISREKNKISIFKLMDSKSLIKIDYSYFGGRYTKREKWPKTAKILSFFYRT